MPQEVESSSQTQSKISTVFAFLLFVTTLLLFSYWPALMGEYVAEDLTSQFVRNPSLASGQLATMLEYQLAPTRPVFHLFAAFVHWLGGGAIFWHRISSLALHGAVVFVAYLNLHLLAKRLSLPFSKGSLVFVCAVMLLHPFAVETLSIALYRWELLGSLFLLLAIYCAQLAAQNEGGRRTWVGIFLFIGLATLSKEVFGLFSLFIPLFFFLGRPRKHGTFWKVFAGALGVWGSISLALCFVETANPAFGNIGWKVLFLPRAYSAMTSAAIDHLFKVLSLSEFSLVPIWYRPTYLKLNSFPLVVNLVILTVLVGATIWFARRSRWNQIWGTAFLASSYFYHLIPKNWGSERCLYFSTICLLAMLVPYLQRHFSATARYAVSLAAIFLVSFVTYQRTTPYKSELTYSLAILDQDPLSKTAWMGVLHTWMKETGRSDQRNHEEYRSRKEIVDQIYRERELNLDLAQSLLQRLFDQPMPERFRQRTFAALQKNV